MVRLPGTSFPGLEWHLLASATIPHPMSEHVHLIVPVLTFIMMHACETGHATHAHVPQQALLAMLHSQLSANGPALL